MQLGKRVAECDSCTAAVHLTSVSIWEQAQVAGGDEIMTSWRRLRLALVLLAAAQITASASTQPNSSRPVPRPVARHARAAPPAPQYITGRIAELGSSFGGRARHDQGEAPRRNPLLQRRARASEQDRRADLEPGIFDRHCLLRCARCAAAGGAQGGLRPLCEQSV